MCRCWSAGTHTLSYRVQNEDPFACWELDKQRQTCCQAFLSGSRSPGPRGPQIPNLPPNKTCNSLAGWMTQLGGFGCSSVLAIMKWHFEMAAAAVAAVSMSWTSALHLASLRVALFVYCRFLMSVTFFPMARLVACGLSPEMYLRATPFIKTLNTKYMACVIVICRVSGLLARRDP